MRRIVIAIASGALVISATASAKVFSTPGWYEVESQGPNFESTVAGPYASEKDCEKKVAAEDEDKAAEVGILFGCDYLKQAMANDQG